MGLPATRSSGGVGQHFVDVRAWRADGRASAHDPFCYGGLAMPLLKHGIPFKAPVALGKMSRGRIISLASKFSLLSYQG